MKNGDSEGTDNLSAFRNALRAGKTAEEAAILTQTGRWAIKHNYKNVEFIGSHTISDTEVIVIFKK